MFTYGNEGKEIDLSVRNTHQSQSRETVTYFGIEPERKEKSFRAMSQS